ncbi:FtsW/RodA/SpoVE family cell cycle protein [Kitasatospora sp. HPMI-4]|uniref:FtsW/RodA/SpoVE family cell cycle protein n=1 Tax=Kitasatospora sp. HPMI-4 TaxID=3448443 RepID=UPI003F1B9028
MAAHVCVGLNRDGSPPHDSAALAGGCAALALVAHLFIRRLAPYADPLLLPLAGFFTLLGVVLIQRLDIVYTQAYGSPATAPSQLMWAVIALAVFLALLAALRDHRVLHRYPHLAALCALVLLMAPAFFPGDTYGAKRWIVFAGLSVQPGEIAKSVIVVFFAGYLASRREVLSLAGRRFCGMPLPRGRDLGPLLAVWAVSLVVLVFERDLGTSLILFGVFVTMLYVATQQTSWLLTSLLLGSAGAVTVGSLEPHVKARVAAWLHPTAIYLPPEQRPAGVISEQPVQALMSFASGGMTGSGLGRGHPELIGFAGRSDFILTTIGEELGLAGLSVVLVLYLLLVSRALRTANALPDPFGRLLAVGLGSTLALQVFVICAGVMGLLPLTGKALPFLALGGSALVGNWALVALLVRLSDRAYRPPPVSTGRAR